MPRVGRILVVCARCGFRLHAYALGDPGDRAKYAGPPVPGVIAWVHAGTCPRCGAPLSASRPRVRILSRAEYEALYAETRYTVTPRRAAITAPATQAQGVTAA